VSTRRYRALLAGGLIVVLGGCAAAWYWFAVRDDDEPRKQPPPAVADQTQTFQLELEGLPFTFDYPKDFAQATPPEGVLWIAGISPNDVIDVRKIEELEFSTQGLKKVIGPRLRGRDDLTVTASGVEPVGDFEALVFSVTTESSTPLSSTLVFFSTGGATWQLECQSQATNQAAMEAACAGAMDSLRPA